MEATCQRGGDAAVAAVGQREGPDVGTSLDEAPRQMVGDRGCGEVALELVGCNEDSHGIFRSQVLGGGVGPVCGAG
jgi:hypothetical protein